MRCLLFVRLYGTAAMALLSVVEKEEPIFEQGARLKIESAASSGGEGPVWHPRLGVLTSGNGHIMQGGGGIDFGGKTFAMAFSGVRINRLPFLALAGDSANCGVLL
ncbi:MAG TPA: hypothetical protein VMG10_04515 [Gemmataceae bacterium]|nr:hypothetical protein [Gemmataceae bacterium]